MLDLRAVDRLHPVERARPPLRSVAEAIRDLARRSPLRQIVLGFLALDLMFIAIQVLADVTDYGFRGAYRLSLETELGVAQSYGIVKTGAAVYLLVLAWRRFASPVAAMWAGALAYLAIDDALGVHESLGTAAVEGLGLRAIGPLRAQDLGELVAYVGIGVIAIGALAAAERRDRADFPTILTSVMVPLAACFVFFAVVMDTVGGSLLPSVLEIAVEDGGELVVLTAFFLFATVWSQQPEELAELSE